MQKMALHDKRNSLHEMLGEIQKNYIWNNNELNKQPMNLIVTSTYPTTVLTRKNWDEH